MTLNIRIKRILNDIIDVAYSCEREEDRRKYKSFRIYIEEKELQSKSGEYRYKDSSIHVYNPRLGSKHMAKTCLHELAHHVDRVKHGKSGHQQPFYDEYAKLIFAALDMGILEPQDFDDVWSRDKNKVKHIVSLWRPKPVEYKLGESSLVKVKGGYAQRETLKARGYFWNKLEQVWEREVPEDAVDSEKSFLQSLGLENVSVGSAADMKIEAMIKIAAKGDTYPVRQVLAKNGFTFEKKSKTWSCRLPTSQRDAKLAMLRAIPELKDISFGTAKR